MNNYLKAKKDAIYWKQITCASMGTHVYNSLFLLVQAVDNDRQPFVA